MILSKIFKPHSRFASSHYRADIDGMRALAVLSVIFYHVQIQGFGGGYVGVDMFFVISGYLVSQIVWNASKANRFSFLHFYERRMRRIVPSVLALLFVAVMGATLVLSVTDMKTYGASMLASLVFAANYFFYFHSGYFDADVSSKPCCIFGRLGSKCNSIYSGRLFFR